MRMSRMAWWVPLALCGWAGRGPSPRAEADGEPARWSAERLLAGGSIGFVENRGQRPGGCAYHLASRDGTIEVGPAGLTYRMSARDGAACDVEMRFVGADPAARPVGEGPLPTRVHHLVGPAERRRTGLRTWARVVYGDLWPGIDLACSIGPGGLKRDFHVRPGADPSRIRVRWSGASSVRVDGTGALVVDTPAGPLRDAAPHAYQDTGDGRRVVACAHSLPGPDESSFEIGDFDRALPLVVDPVEVVYATFLGAARADRVSGVAVDAQGAAYVTGVTTGVALDPLDAFVAKVAPDGKSVVWWTTIGGSLNEEGRAIAVDRQGRACVAGTTASPDFACRVGPDTTYGGGVSDAFVAKLKPDGDGFVFAGYVGGARRDFAEGVAVDAAGNVYLEGPTTSDERSFPVAVGPDLTHNGKFDLFVAKVAADGSRFLYAGYVGGDEDDSIALPDGDAWGGDMALDAEGALYVAGMTASTERTFPTGQGFGETASFDRTHNGLLAGWGDGYAVKVRPDGTGLAWAGYLGGKGADQAMGVAVDAEGNAFVVGTTGSDETTFPGGEGVGDLPGLHRKPLGTDDAFVAKVRADGKALLWATYLGSPGAEQGLAVACEPAGDVVVAGVTSSAQFPHVSGPDATYNEGSDVFLARLSGDGTRLLASGFVGGAGYEHARAVALDAAGNAYLVGETTSTDETFPDGAGMASRVGKERRSLGGVDGFLVKVSK